MATATKVKAATTGSAAGATRARKAAGGADAAVAGAGKPGPVRRTVTAGRRDDEALAAAFKHLADATRLRVLRRIAERGAANVTDLGAEVGMSQPATSHHLAILRHARIIDGRREGKTVIYSLTPRGEVLAKVVAELSRLG